MRTNKKSPRNKDRRILRRRKSQLEALENRHLLSAVPFSDPISISSPQEIRGPRQVDDIELADLDGDGDNDLLLAQYNHDSTAEVVWYINDGAGQFGSAARQSLGESSNVTLADINGDGAKDLLTVRQNSFVWFENTLSTTATFAAEPQTIELEDTTTIARPWTTADLNGDGRDDLIMPERVRTGRNVETNIVWRENLGAEDFVRHQLTTAGDPEITLRNSADIIARDTDGDGDLDLVFRGDRITTFENLGGDSGASLFGAAVTADWEIATNEFVDTYDVDQDGDEDALVTNDGRQSFDGRPFVSWAENSEGQLLAPKTIQSFEQRDAPGMPRRAAFRFDVDGDGREEMIATNGRTLTWYSDNGATLEFQDTRAQHKFAVDDIDGDGDPDWVATDIVGDHIAWFDGIGDGSIENTVETTDLYGPRNPTAVDMDADGDLDIVVRSTDALKWYENTGDGQFAAVDTLVAKRTFDPTIVDLNGDNLPDLADSHFDFTTLTFITEWTPNSSEGLGEPITLTGDTGAVFLDVDADGDIDYVQGFVDGKPSFAHLNDGLGNFPTTLQLPNGLTPRFDVLDADGDGDQDFIASDNGELILFENWGDEDYERLVIVEATPNSRLPVINVDHIDFQLADIDGDGDKEILVLYDFQSGAGLTGLGPTHRLQILTNADGEYTTANDIVVRGNTSLRGMDLSDLDGDGDLDITVTPNGKVTYYENLGGLQFEKARTVPNTASTNFLRDLEIADVNGDGAPDMLVVFDGEDRLTLLSNERTGGKLIVTPVEIDAIYAAINAGSDDEEHDWNGDGVVNVADVDYVLKEIVGTVRGDADLDGDVDFQDFLSIIPTFGQQNVGWAGGDFDGDGTFAFSELLLVFSNFGFDADDQ